MEDRIQIPQPPDINASPEAWKEYIEDVSEAFLDTADNALMEQDFLPLSDPQEECVVEGFATAFSQGMVVAARLIKAGYSADNLEQMRKYYEKD